jgi:hypothetical protein
MRDRAGPDLESKLSVIIYSRNPLFRCLSERGVGTPLPVQKRRFSDIWLARWTATASPPSLPPPLPSLPCLTTVLKLHIVSQKEFKSYYRGCIKLVIIKFDSHCAVEVIFSSLNTCLESENPHPITLSSPKVHYCSSVLDTHRFS